MSVIGQRSPLKEGHLRSSEFATSSLRPLWEKVGRVSGSDEGSIFLSSKLPKSLGKVSATPHPSAALTPSPTRGEGNRRLHGRRTELFNTPRAGIVVR